MRKKVKMNIDWSNDPSLFNSTIKDNPKTYDMHCHILNSQLYPPDVFFSRLNIPKLWVLAGAEVAKEAPFVIKWINKLAEYAQSDKTLHLKEVAKVFNSNFMECADHMLLQMDKAKIDIATPLMLDFGCGNNKDYVEMPWELQIENFGRLHERSNGRLMPFYGYDPRRKDATKLAIAALESKKFFGLKFYTPQGFSPDPNSSANTGQVNKELRDMYTYCVQYNIPITAHCSGGGVRGAGISQSYARYLSSPASWWGALWEFPTLKINLAHAGGNSAFMDCFNKGRHNITSMIVDLMMEFENVYMDLSFHEAMVNAHKRYFQALVTAFDDIWCSDKILFGTDTPLTLALYNPKEAADMFNKKLSLSIRSTVSGSSREFLNLT